MAIDHQQQLNHSDLLLGRMTRAFDSATATIEQAKAMIKERDDMIAKHEARIKELEEIIETLADEDESDDDAE